MPTYETALMRQYYNGRTETVRSCTADAVKWVKTFDDPNETVRKYYLQIFNFSLKMMK